MDGEVFGHIALILILGGSTVIGLIHVLGKHVVRGIRAWRETQLKLRMVELGYTPEQIEKVLRMGTAGPGSTNGAARKHPAGEAYRNIPDVSARR